MVLWFIRALFILLMASILLWGFGEGGPFNQFGEKAGVYNDIVFILCAGVVVLGLAVDLLVKRKSLAGLAGIFFGLVVGLLVGSSFAKVIDLVLAAANVSRASNLFWAVEGIKLVIYVFCTYLSVVFIMQTKDDFRFIIPYVEFSKQMKGVCPVILDTSVIIDGRIADIAATRILNAPMIVPRFVLNELQQVADSADRLRRNRGRRGLDMLNKMQNDVRIELTIRDIEFSPREQAEPVDLKLVTAAQKLAGRIVTNDYNLNKMAALRGVEVININDLANAIKSVMLPGEAMRVKLVKPGDQPGQGVGYLDDGTMIVVEQGRALLGQEVEMIVTSVLQTSAGRMVFGRIEDGPAERSSPGGGGPRRSYNNAPHAS
jgi:uncharacterized protein YacL